MTINPNQCLLDILIQEININSESNTKELKLASVNLDKNNDCAQVLPNKFVIFTGGKNDLLLVYRLVIELYF